MSTKTLPRNLENLFQRTDEFTRSLLYEWADHAKEADLLALSEAGERGQFRFGRPNFGRFMGDQVFAASKAMLVVGNAKPKQRSDKAARARELAIVMTEIVRTCKKFNAEASKRHQSAIQQGEAERRRVEQAIEQAQREDPMWRIRRLEEHLGLELD